MFIFLIMLNIYLKIINAENYDNIDKIRHKIFNMSALKYDFNSINDLNILSKSLDTINKDINCENNNVLITLLPILITRLNKIEYINKYAEDDFSSFMNRLIDIIYNYIECDRINENMINNILSIFKHCHLWLYSDVNQLKMILYFHIRMRNNDNMFVVDKNAQYIIYNILNSEYTTIDKDEIKYIVNKYYSKYNISINNLLILPYSYEYNIPDTNIIYIIKYNDITSHKIEYLKFIINKIYNRIYKILNVEKITNKTIFNIRIYEYHNFINDYVENDTCNIHYKYIDKIFHKCVYISLLKLNLYDYNNLPDWIQHGYDYDDYMCINNVSLTDTIKNKYNNILFSFIIDKLPGIIKNNMYNEIENIINPENTLLFNEYSFNFRYCMYNDYINYKYIEFIHLSNISYIFDDICDNIRFSYSNISIIANKTNIIFRELETNYEIFKKCLTAHVFNNIISTLESNKSDVNIFVKKYTTFGDVYDICGDTKLSCNDNQKIIHVISPNLIINSNEYIFKNMDLNNIASSIKQVIIKTINKKINKIIESEENYDDSSEYTIHQEIINSTDFDNILVNYTNNSIEYSHQVSPSTIGIITISIIIIVIILGIIIVKIYINYKKNKQPVSETY
jgi:hypothetical protein